MICILAIYLISGTATVEAQSPINQENYAANDTFTRKGGISVDSHAAIMSDKMDINYANLNNIIAASYLDPSDGFIGLLFSHNVTSPNIYYKIVDQAGREVYNGSAHAAAENQLSLYYNTQNLPSGRYRVYVENADFFISTSFIK